MSFIFILRLFSLCLHVFLSPAYHFPQDWHIRLDEAQTGHSSSAWKNISQITPKGTYRECFWASISWNSPFYVVGPANEGLFSLRLNEYLLLSLATEMQPDSRFLCHSYAAGGPYFLTKALQTLNSVPENGLLDVPRWNEINQFEAYSGTFLTALTQKWKHLARFWPLICLWFDRYKANLFSTADLLAQHNRFLIPR